MYDLFENWLTIRTIVVIAFHKMAHQYWKKFFAGVDLKDRRVLDPAGQSCYFLHLYGGWYR